MSAHLRGCGAGEDPDGETTCVCEGIEAAAAEADSHDGDDCYAELIDGSWTYCGCPDCEGREVEDGEAEAEYGLTDAF